MKPSLGLAIILLGVSTLSHAAEYKRIKTTCRISGSVQDVDTPEQVLPYTIGFDFFVTFESDKCTSYFGYRCSIVRESIDIRPDPRSATLLRDDLFTQFRGSQDNKTIVFPLGESYGLASTAMVEGWPLSLAEDKVRFLFLYFGADQAHFNGRGFIEDAYWSQFWKAHLDRSRALPNIITSDLFRTGGNPLIVMPLENKVTYTAQLHYPLNQFNGVSYHLITRCDDPVVW